ncbi:WD40/YVTN/BNR-like repeat-containing protein [Mucilaginibacter ginsenosidivorans]|uniref:Exo-alpha-sialidase n=1 Tax=Mucilaginibacter ginsenosidivorans TaxID=398053 RepID=A0A5B8UZK3_9SPHI|nr:exo-alpha-sialidase [Mucilaginibacter ginsenosidivorans]QEC64647.1 exo-alpha-sialidase [Mucilaginibacter ginsenosidivorans]
MKNKKIKRSLVFAPAILVVLFLLNSFVVKEKKAWEKTAKGTKSAHVPIIFRSTDGGQTWQDISKGLPENLQREGVWRDGLLANDRGLYLRAGNGVYHSEPNSTTPFWTKEVLSGPQRNIAPGNNGIFAYDFRGQFLKKINGRSEWSPVYANFQEEAVRLNRTIDWMYKNYKEKQVSSLFETTRGTVFIGSNNALYKSNNSGKTWKYVPVGGWVMKIAESNGVLLASSSQGILRSTDDGESWVRVISEGDAGIAVERIDGGFAAIVNNKIAHSNSVHISRDNGKTWNTIGEELQPSWSNSLMGKIGLVQSSSDISSIKQMGKYLICGRSDEIFRSSDMGKTWEKLSLPAIGNFGFDLSVSGNVIYAIPNKGC